MTSRSHILGFRPHALMMSLMFMGAIAVGYLLLPGENERIAMLEGDGHDREALRILEERFATGDRRQSTLYQLQGLYEQFGNLPKLRQTLELLAEQRSRDATLQRKLAQLYKQVQEEQAYLGVLKKQIDLRGSESACKELIGRLRLKGEAEREAAAILTCRQKGYRRSEDVARLASMAAVDGDMAQASSLLRSIDDLKRLKGDRERLQLFSLLLEMDQPREALRRAVRWIKGGKNDALASTLVDMLATANRHDIAIELAREVSGAGEPLGLTTAELMLGLGQTAAAQTQLRGWLDGAALGTSALAARFIEVALEADDAESALLGGRKFGLARLSVTTRQALADALSADGQLSEAEEVRSTLPVGFTDGAESEGGQAPSRAIEPADDLQSWRLSLWSRLREESERAVADAEAEEQSEPEPVLVASKGRRVAHRRTAARRFKVRRDPPVKAQQPPAEAASTPALIQNLFLLQ